MSLRRILATWLILAGVPISAAAQTPPDADAPQPTSSTPTASSGSLTVSAIMSIQPAGEVLRTGSAYLDEGVGGIVPGIAVSIAGASAQGLMMGFEGSTTWRIATSQRFRGGAFPDRTIETTHTDMLLSVLTGFRSKRGSSTSSGRGESVEFRFGGTFILGHTSADGMKKTSARLGGTGGLDLVLRSKNNQMVVAGARFTYVFRGDDNDQALGPYIVRLGIGFRWE